ncbi:MAG TPA: hypothetical protein VGQ09_14105 [Chitinophagaceae bacterium]|jgi:hypothetical protein|nr:hypothetical protein [Chitinophagaceae bacterium]
MRRISLWAKNHKWLARATIIGTFILLNCLGIVTGILFDELKISIPYFAFVVTVCFYFLAFILYPQKKQRKNMGSNAFYVKQKSCDLILSTSTFFIAICIGNRPDLLFFKEPAVNATVISSTSLSSDSTAKNYKSISSFSSSMKDENGKSVKWKERKKLLRHQIKGIKRSNDLSDGEKVILIILSVLAAIGLLYLVAAAACSLACAGSDGAALLVAIGGTGFVIFLLVITIRAIMGKKKRAKQQITTAN